MSQQEFSYLGPEQETVYEPHDINRDPRESREEQAQQEQTVYYVTPEQSMLRGEKLIPVRRTKSYAHWIAVAIFLLMMLIGGLIWSLPVRPTFYSGPPCQRIYVDGQVRCEKLPNAQDRDNQVNPQDKEKQFEHPHREDGD